MNKIYNIFIFLSIIAGGAALSDTADAKPLPVFVSIAPQRFFVQQIGRDLVEVHVMVAPGASPHNYEPKPSQMAALSTARIYFAIGVPFEAVWLEKIAAANPPIRVVHTDAGIRKIPMAEHHHEGEEHGEGHGHGEEAHDHGDAHEH